MRWILVVAAGAALVGCGRSAELVPLNAEATALGIPRLEATLYGTGYGPVTVTMPSGEVLNGHYRLRVGGSVSTGFATAQSRRGSAVVTGSAFSTPMENPFALQVTGASGTTMICSGSGGGFGHGDAICQTNSGAEYQMMF